MFAREVQPCQQHSALILAHHGAEAESCKDLIQPFNKLFGLGIYSPALGENFFYFLEYIFSAFKYLLILVATVMVMIFETIQTIEDDII